jgi:hypothetical protein
MLEVSEAVGAFEQTVCCVVGQHDTCFSGTAERNSLGVTWFRIEISCGLTEYSAGLCEHGTGTVADFVSTVLVFVTTVLEQWRNL